jgi:hypothetical protein
MHAYALIFTHASYIHMFNINQVLSKDEWLCFWDHLLSHPDDPLLVLVPAYTQTSACLRVHAYLLVPAYLSADRSA